MLVAFMDKPAGFAEAEGPAELLEKRSKNVERAEKKAEAATKPKEVDKAALAKKTRVQRDALDLLERLVLDTASAGLGKLDRAKATRLAEQARQMNDAYLPGAGHRAAAADCAAGDRHAVQCQGSRRAVHRPGRDRQGSHGAGTAVDRAR